MGRILEAVAFESMPMRAVTQTTKRFGPKALILESYRQNKWEAGAVSIEGVDSLWYVPPSWRPAVNRIPRGAYVGSISPLADRAFSLGFYALIQRGGYSLRGRLPLSELSEGWLDEYAKY